MGVGCHRVGTRGRGRRGVTASSGHPRGLEPPGGTGGDFRSSLRLRRTFPWEGGSCPTGRRHGPGSSGSITVAPSRPICQSVLCRSSKGATTGPVKGQDSDLNSNPGPPAHQGGALLRGDSHSGGGKKYGTIPHAVTRTCAEVYIGFVLRGHDRATCLEHFRNLRGRACSIAHGAQHALRVM